MSSSRLNFQAMSGRALSRFIAWKSFTYLSNAALSLNVPCLIKSTAQLGAILDLADVLIFIMALPNLIGLFIMAPEVKGPRNIRGDAQGLTTGQRGNAV